MELDFLNNILNLNNQNKKIDENTDAKLELAKKLGAVQEYTIDRFEENFAVLENRETREMKNINISKIPIGAEEGDILKEVNGEFYLDKEKTQEVENEIENKYKNLWN